MLSQNLEQYAIGNGFLEFASFILPVFIFAILTDKFEEAKNDSVLGREYLLDIGRAGAIALLILVLYLGVDPRHAFLLAVPFLLMGLFAHEPKKGKAVLPVGTGHSDQLH